MAPKVRLYEDIDGCLNASLAAVKWHLPEDGEDRKVSYLSEHVLPLHDDFGVKQEPRPAGGWGDYFKGYKMEWSSRLIDALNSLDVEVVWATTWREDARLVGAAMGLTHEAQRVLHPLSGQTTFPSISWKYDSLIEEQQRDPSPFIWVDDELEFGVPEAVKESIHQLGGLIIGPNPDFGISPEHIEAMREYIEAHS